MAYQPLPVLGSNNANYLTEQQALTDMGGLRALYAGHGLNEGQRNQLEMAVQQGIANIKNIYFAHSYSTATGEEQRQVKAMIAKVRELIRTAVTLHDQKQAQRNAANAGSSASASAPPVAEQSAEDAQRRSELLHEYDRINRNMAIRQHPHDPAAAHQLIADAEQHKPRLAALPLPKLAHFVNFVEEEARKHTQTLAQNPNLTLHSLGRGGRNSHFSYLTSRQAARYAQY